MQSWAASFAVALCGAIWGVYWLPLRHLNHIGFSGSWATAAYFIVALPPALVSSFWRGARSRRSSAFFWLALFNGPVFDLYSQRLCRHHRLQCPVPVLPLPGLEHPDHALPARGAGRRRLAWAASSLGLIGLVLMLSGDGGWPIPRNPSTGWPWRQAFLGGYCHSGPL